MLSAHGSSVVLRKRVGRPIGGCTLKKGWRALKYFKKGSMDPGRATIPAITGSRKSVAAFDLYTQEGTLGVVE